MKVHRFCVWLGLMLVSAVPAHADFSLDDVMAAIANDVIRPNYNVLTNNSADLDMLDEEDQKGFEDIFKPEIFDSFDKAFERFLDKYPIFRLYPEKIDPAYKSRIKKYYTKYQ